MGFLDKLEGALQNLVDKMDAYTEEQDKKLKAQIEEREAKREAKAEQEVEMVETLPEEVIIETQKDDYPTEIEGFATVPEMVRDAVWSDWLLYFANQGDAEFQKELGFSYYHGRGVPQNHAKALEWWEKAGEQGDAECCDNCGSMYYNGDGTLVNYDKAIYWWEKAVDCNSLKNLDMLLSLYSSKKDDNVAAAKCVQKAANLGDPKSMCTLGTFYMMGLGVESNVRIAVNWWEKSIEHGYATAYTLLGDWFNPDHEIQDFAPSTNLEANREIAIAYYEKAAGLGDGEGMYELAQCYLLGNGVQEDYRLAAEWYKKAANTGFEKSYEILARLYLHGDGVRQDDKEFFKWAKKAADTGSQTAMLLVARAYRFGRGIDENMQMAYRYYEELIKFGDVDAKVDLATIFLAGEDQSYIDTTRAINLSREAAESGNAEGQYLLGVCYADVKNEEQLAIEWWKKAALQGHEDAIEALAEYGIEV